MYPRHDSYNRILPQLPIFSCMLFFQLRYQKKQTVLLFFFLLILLRVSFFNYRHFCSCGLNKINLFLAFSTLICFCLKMLFLSILAFHPHRDCFFVNKAEAFWKHSVFWKYSYVFALQCGLWKHRYSCHVLRLYP